MKTVKHIFTEDEDNYIYKHYSDMTIKQIASNLNLTEAQIRHRIQRHLNIKPSKLKKHFHDKTIFENDSSEKYYILGLISADGNMWNGNRNRHKISISLHSDDRQLLVDINNLICKTNIVYDRNNSKMSELVIYDKDIYNIIKSYGINENKSLTLKFPKNIPDKYTKDYIRGYFDGDGSIITSKENKKSKYEKLTLQFLGTEDFLIEISKVIDNIFGFGIKRVTNTHTNIKCLRYYTKQAREIAKWLYDTNSLKLKRKYQHFKKYLNNFND